jgi:hypothetical protein
MPDAGASRKRQIPVRRIPCDLDGLCGDHATKSTTGRHRSGPPISGGLGVKSAAVIGI